MLSPHVEKCAIRMKLIGLVKGHGSETQNDLWSVNVLECDAVRADPFSEVDQACLELTEGYQ